MFIFQGSYDAYDLLSDDKAKQQALLKYFSAKVYIGMDFDELEQLGNMHNKVGHVIMKRNSVEIIKSLRRGWVKAKRPSQPANKLDKKYREMKEGIFRSIEIKDPGEWNNYSHEWTLATAPDEFFTAICRTFKLLETGSLLHQAAEKRREEAAIAKERKKQSRSSVSSSSTYPFDSSFICI